MSTCFFAGRQTVVFSSIYIWPIEIIKSDRTLTIVKWDCEYTHVVRVSLRRTWIRARPEFSAIVSRIFRSNFSRYPPGAVNSSRGGRWGIPPEISCECYRGDDDEIRRHDPKICRNNNNPSPPPSTLLSVSRLGVKHENDEAEGGHS